MEAKGYIEQSRSCNACDGTGTYHGKYSSHKCIACKGKGTITDINCAVCNEPTIKESEWFGCCSAKCAGEHYD